MFGDIVKKLIALLFIVLMLVMVSCGEKALKKEKITIFHATDMHYLSQRLTENSPAFVEMIQGGDGKMVHYIDYIMDAFISDVIEVSPSDKDLTISPTFLGSIGLPIIHSPMFKF